MKILNNRYEILESVGQGAAAVVHKVRDRRDGSVKVAKLLHAASAARDETVRRFEDEFRILRGLHHPSLPEVFDYGWTEGQSRFMVMEFVEGQPLDKYIKEHPEDLWVILYQLCEVLTFIHSHGLLHQDVKPGNILVKRIAAFGEEMPLCVLIDFGLTYRRGAAEDVVMVGTPEYMAPEIIRGEAPLTRAVDYYSLGVTLYQIVAEELPFQGSGREIFDGHLNRQVRFAREKIEHAELYPHIRGLMSKDRRARLESFEEFKRAVVGRMTGGIDELDKAYGLARINSLGMIGKDDVWNELMEWLDDLVDEQAEVGLSRLVQGAAQNGKTFLAARFSEECRMRGLNCLLVDQSTMAARHVVGRSARDGGIMRWAGIWDELTRESQRGAIIVVDDVEDLGAEEKKFLVYLKERLTIAEASGQRKKVATLFLVSRPDVPAAVGWRPVQMNARLLPPSAKELESLASSLPARHLGGSERKKLASVLGAVAHAVGPTIEALRLVISSNRIDVVRESGLDSNANCSAQEHYSRTLRNSPEEVRRVLRAISCSPRPVDLPILEQVVGCDHASMQKVLEEAQAYVPLAMVGIGRERSVGFENDGTRRAVYLSMEEDIRRRFHEKYVVVMSQALGLTSGPPPRNSDLVTHLSLGGDIRGALILCVRHIRDARRRPDWHSVRSFSRIALEICDLPLGRKRVSPLVVRYFVDQLIDAEWEQNDFQSIRGILEDRYGEDISLMPRAFVAKYISSLRNCDGVELARKRANESLRLMGCDYPLISLLVQIELALVELDAGDLSLALRMLDQVKQSSDALALRDKYRLQLYYALIWVRQGRRAEALALLGSIEDHLERLGFVDEYIVLQLVKVNELIDMSNFSDAMSGVIRALRKAHNHDLHFRRGRIYLQASAIYYEQGAYDRALRYLGRAVAIMEDLGAIALLAEYSFRFAMISQSMGLFGNAIGYVERAVKLGDGVKTEEFQSYARLVAFEIAIQSGGKIRSATVDELSKHMKAVDDVAQRAFFRYLMGEYRMSLGEYAAACIEYGASRECYESGGIDDDALESALGESSARLAMSDWGKLAALDDYVLPRLTRITSPRIQARHRIYQLSRLLKQDATTDQVRRAAEECALALGKHINAEQRLRGTSLLFRVFRKLGEEERAAVWFQQWYSLTRTALANLPREAAAGFMARYEVGDLLNESQSLLRE